MTASRNSGPDITAVGRREFLIGGALAGCTLVSSALAFRTEGAPLPPPDLATLVPKVIGQWRQGTGGSIPIPQGEGAGEDVYDQLVSRHYASVSQPTVMLLIAYGAAQRGSTQLHRPEACYPAAGFRLIDKSPSPLPVSPKLILPARKLTAVAPRRTEQILYWSRIGTEFPEGSVQQRWSVLRQTLRHGAPDGVLVRLSTIDSDSKGGQATLQRFVNALVAAGGPSLDRLLLGRN